MLILEILGAAALAECFLAVGVGHFLAGPRARPRGQAASTCVLAGKPLPSPRQHRQEHFATAPALSRERLDRSF